MSTLQFLSKYLASPIVAHRQKAMISLFKEVFTNPKALNAIALNLKSDNFDIVQNSLRVLLAVCYRNAKKIKPLQIKLIALAQKTNHFAILKLCHEILSLVNIKDSRVQELSRKLTANLITRTNDEYFYDNCNHSLEYLFHSKDCAYELAHICRAFRYDCKRAEKQVIRYMKSMGYKKGSQYWRQRPYLYEYDFEGKRFETTIHYYSRHSIQMFLLWCFNNLSISKEDVDELFFYERNWDPSIPKLLVQQQPDLIKFPDMELAPEKWLRKKIIKNDVYNLISDKSSVWFPLYEDTKLRTDKKSYSKYVSVCFIKKPIGKITKSKDTTPTVHYICRNCYINEVPEWAFKNGFFSTENESSTRLEDKLISSFGYIQDEFDDILKLFPAPEIFDFFRLKQKNNTLEYYKGTELVVQCINWQAGFHRNVGVGREERFELSNYGSLLLIKTKFLKKYLKAMNFKLFARGSITKHLVNDYKTFDIKDYMYKWIPFEIIDL